jgi:Response regulator containing a CheY-like receiver domain and an HTH DNA-binding domain
LIGVLIADNNIQLCAALSEFLNAQEDIEVVGCAYDGEEALEMLEKTEPDVLVLDITMPRLDGLGVLECMGDLPLRKRPRVIVLTALARDDIARRFAEMGADYYVLKPFDMQLLAERIRQFSSERSRSWNAASPRPRPSPPSPRSPTWKPW